MFFTHGIDLDTAPLPIELIKEPATINLLYYIQEYTIMPFNSGPGSYIVIKISKIRNKKQGHF